MPEIARYTFQDFITDLEMITTLEQDDAEKIKKIARRMRLLLNGEDFLTDEEKKVRQDHYARHLVHVDRKRRFIVVSIVWGPGQGTPIHDHATWGVAGVVSGELKVTNYYRIDDGKSPGFAELREASAIVAPRGTVTYVLPPNEEIHKMENVSDQPTITLHVYGKEIAECNMYNMAKKTMERWRLSYTNVTSVER